MSGSDDGWSDEEVAEAPKVLMTCRVVKEWKPELEDFWDPKKPDNSLLPLELDHIVYIFKKSSDRSGYWEGESKGVYGAFPSRCVKQVETEAPAQ